jgi:hypothetical protein
MATVTVNRKIMLGLDPSARVLLPGPEGKHGQEHVLSDSEMSEWYIKGLIEDGSMKVKSDSVPFVPEDGDLDPPEDDDPEVDGDLGTDFESFVGQEESFVGQEGPVAKPAKKAKVVEMKIS